MSLRSWPPRRSRDRSHGVNRIRAKVPDEMGATLDLSRAAKAVLMATIAAAIEAAIDEEHERLICVQ